ncbi:hypothetical protein [Saccharopolyspora phatthalungensis]|uniref:Uncharacterized protein n=1 Tax=Saccharopolyspora phatthalungensis TaxID=664693 RepID=A0A840Q9R9_9PSEU|nr:hypothetical protein [Saccharopolyspora phatthalungensis]MBB5155195.1 hypothetical protein [Saccharopolyspora phatthalungensis]
MAGAAVADDGVSLRFAVRPARTGGRRSDALRGCASGFHRILVVVNGTAHPLPVSQPADPTVVGHVGRSVCGLLRKGACRES